MRRIAAPLLIVALAAPVADAAPGPQDLARANSWGGLQQAEQRLQQILSRLAEQRRRLVLVRSRERRLLDELEGIDRTQEQAAQRLAALAEESSQTDVRARAVAAELAQTEQRLRERRVRLGGRLRQIYKYGRTGYVEVLLGADGFASFVTRWHLIATIVRQDTEAIDAYAADVARYRRLQAALEQDRAYLATLTAQAVVRRREIAAQAQAKRALLTRTQTERAAYERVVRELERNSRDLEVLIRRVQAPPPRTAVAEARAPFAFAWPARGAFTSGFGRRRHPIFGIWHLHTGVDIAATWGAPVLAAADGRVIYAGWFGGYGKIVIIDHGGGMSTLYGHMSTILVASGDAVRRGEPIGRVGSTGYSTGPHLHFEIRVNGTPVNPTGF